MVLLNVNNIQDGLLILFNFIALLFNPVIKGRLRVTILKSAELAHLIVSPK